MAESKLAQFLATKKLNSKRVLAVSHKLETLTREDRAHKLARRQAKKAEGGEKKEVAKPRSGRPVTPRAMEAALKGTTISGPTKQRILRAVNYLLEQKKAEKVDLKTLF
jgi:hypothetical protein